MAFVRRKGRYYQLVHSYRDGAKVRQRVVAHLGRNATVEDAFQYWKRQANRNIRKVTEEEWNRCCRYYRSIEEYKRHAREMMDTLTPYRDEATVKEERRAQEAREADPVWQAKRKARSQAYQRKKQEEWKNFLAMKDVVPNSHHATLGLKPGASKQEIKQAWRDKVKVHHPDVGGDAAKFRDIQSAYEALAQR